jgi:hypothetical protein
MLTFITRINFEKYYSLGARMEKGSVSWTIRARAAVVYFGPLSQTGIGQLGMRLGISQFPTL